MKKEYKRNLAMAVIFAILVLIMILVSIGIFALLQATTHLTLGQMLLFPILVSFILNMPVFLLFEAYYNMLKRKH